MRKTTATILGAGILAATGIVATPGTAHAATAAP